MAAPIERLKQHAEFLHVAAARQKWVTPGLILQAAVRSSGQTGSQGFRIGYTASRRVGGAVARNRARRRLRAAVAQVMPDHGVRGMDYVIIARQATATRGFADLTADLTTAFDGLARKTRQRAVQCRQRAVQ